MRKFKIVLLTLTLVACARPRYAVRGAGGVSEQSTDAACTTRLGADCLSAHWESVKFGGRNFSSLLLKIGRPNLADGSLLVVDGDYDLDVELWMPEMGHGTGPVHIARVDVGTYRVSHVYLPHGGLWEVRISRRARDPSERGGSVERAALRFTL